MRRWLPELSRLPTEWIHHPWNAPESVLQAAGIELGSNYPLPIVGIDAAKNRLLEALSKMWQQEAASRAAMENGTEEGLGDSSESVPAAFPQDTRMEETHEPVRNNPLPIARRYQDQMVPSITSSLLRVEEEETSSDLRNSAEESSRAEVPVTANAQQNAGVALNERMLQTTNRNTQTQYNTTMDLRNVADDSAVESSSGTRRERDGGLVPVWSPPASSYSEQFVGDENGITSSSSYLQRHPQSHQMLNWKQLPQTG